MCSGVLFAAERVSERGEEGEEKSGACLKRGFWMLILEDGEWGNGSEWVNGWDRFCEFLVVFPIVGTENVSFQVNGYCVWELEISNCVVGICYTRAAPVDF